MTAAYQEASGSIRGVGEQLDRALKKAGTTSALLELPWSEQCVRRTSERPWRADRFVLHRGVSCRCAQGASRRAYTLNLNSITSPSATDPHFLEKRLGFVGGKVDEVAPYLRADHDGLAGEMRLHVVAHPYDMGIRVGRGKV